VLNRFSGSLDCLFYPSWISSVPARKGLRDWMLSSLQWHRVCYTRPGTTFKINTPRFTTTFGMLTGPQAPPLTSYKIRPKEIPGPLRELKERIEAMQSAAGVEVTYNAAIVNFYATGEDSISYHADDEAFLGPEPNIASLSLGATRDFYLRRKQPEGVPVAPATSPSGSKGVGSAKDRPMEKLQLSEGALLIMRGKTQAEWEHSIPKRKGVKEGRINITFRKAIDRKAIDNFTRYNRGDGGGYRWNGSKMIEGTGGI
jgi:alkylated DNA repair dioxygenase AlkB